MIKETQSGIHLGPVVQRVDNAIHWINRYLVHTSVCPVNTYPLDGDLSVGQYYPSFELCTLQEDHSVIVHALLDVKKT